MERTALIVDDNSMNLETLALLLNREGFSTVTLLSPRDIFDALEEIEERVEIVFLDLEFPNYDGIEIVSSIAAHERLQGVPIVAYSVHISEVQAVRDAGFHSFIGKPLDVERFPEQLRLILSGQSVWEVGQ